MSEVSSAPFGYPILTALVFLPLVGAAVIFFVKEGAIRWVALAVSLVEFVISLPLWLSIPQSPACSSRNT